MIVGPDFVWLHFPKTGGTSTELFLRDTFRDRKDVFIDEINENRVIWHHSIADRMAEVPDFSIDGRRIICGFRRLPAWVISRAIYEAMRPPFQIATREMIERGEFFERDGTVNTADNYLQHYRKPRVDNWIRCEHIADDIATAFAMPAADVRLRLQVKNQTRRISKVSFWYTKPQLERLYECNPHWAKLERELYGQLL